jgi:hypothetical protein
MPPELLKQVAAAAILAPSTHNTQPWRYRITGGALELHADERRHLSVIDGDRRQLVQSCGCALFNACVAMRAFGFADRVELFPDPAEPGHLATLRPGAKVITQESDIELMHAIPLRHTNRRPFLDSPVPPPHVEALAVAAASEGAWVARLDPVRKRLLAGVIDRADRSQYANPAFRRELGHWLAGTPSRRRDGIPFAEKEYGSAMPFAVMRAMRSLELGADLGEIEEHLVRRAPIVVVLGTERDQPEDWLAAGQALQALLLHATVRGMAASFLNQVLEVPELRAEVAELTQLAGYPQMVLRVGYPAEAVKHPAPRRALDDVLLVVD